MFNIFKKKPKGKLKIETNLFTPHCKLFYNNYRVAETSCVINTQSSIKTLLDSIKKGKWLIEKYALGYILIKDTDIRVKDNYIFIEFEDCRYNLYYKENDVWCRVYRNMVNDTFIRDLNHNEMLELKDNIEKCFYGVEDNVHSEKRLNYGKKILEYEI